MLLNSSRIEEFFDQGTLVDNIKSVSGAVWLNSNYSENIALSLQQRFGISDIFSRILAARGIDQSNFDDYINPKLRNLLPNPFSLIDMEKAVGCVVRGITAKDKIAVFGDYDVDGATSSALLKNYFLSIGQDIEIYIPDRIKEGYGPNIAALDKLQQMGIKICITVDCGTAASKELAHAKSINLKMIVLDHHLSSPELPEAEAIVNPNRFDETSPYKYLAAVGVTFLFIIALNTRLKEIGYFNDRKIPDLLQFLDLVALGTVCDIVPLKGLNRAFVAQGLKIMAKRQNIGIKALSDVAALESSPDAYHLGFILGPRINAGGRVGKSSYGAEILSTTDEFLAKNIAFELNNLNEERKAIETLVLEEAFLQIESKKSDKNVIFAVGDNWHPGVIGIVASRIKDRYHKPCAVIAVENNVGKASARSITGVDFGAAIVAANSEGLLLAGGGHAMAAGFSIQADKIEILESYLSEKFAPNFSEYSIKKIKIDAYITIAGLNRDLLNLIETIAPFGVGNPEPKFVIPNVRILKVDVLKNKHIICYIADNLADNSKKSLKALAFNSYESPLGSAIIKNQGKIVHMLGRPKINSWQGRENIEFFIEDMAIG